jgi:hypothetical protein
LLFEVSNFDKILDLQDQYVIIERLWLGRKEFYDFLSSIETVHFLKLDFLTIENFSLKMKKLAA